MRDDQLTENDQMFTSIKSSIIRLLDSDDREHEYHSKFFANPLTCDTAITTWIENPINMFKIEESNKPATFPNRCIKPELIGPLREKHSAFDIFNSLYHFASIKTETKTTTHSELIKATNNVRNRSLDTSLESVLRTPPNSPIFDKLPSLLDVIPVRVQPVAPVQQNRGRPIRPNHPAMPAPRAQGNVPARPAAPVHPILDALLANPPPIRRSRRSPNSQSSEESEGNQFCHICYLKQLNICKEERKPEPRFFENGAPWNNHRTIGTKNNITLITCPILYFHDFPECITSKRKASNASTQ